MDTDNQVKDETVNLKTEQAEGGIETHTLETDMEALGIDVEESIVEEPDAAQKQQEEQHKQPKKSRAQRTIERLKRENKALREAPQQEAKPETVKADAKEIDINDFENYDDYLVALEESENAAPQKEATKAEPEAKGQDTRVNDLFEDGEEDFENFRELVSAEDLKLSQPMLEEVLEYDNPAAMAYYLATHKDLSAKIAGMSTRQMQRELVKIELELGDEPENKVVRHTNAPDPINPIDGQSAEAKSLDDDNISFEQHEKLLNAKTRKQSGGFL